MREFGSVRPEQEGSGKQVEAFSFLMVPELQMIAASAFYGVPGTVTRGGEGVLRAPGGLY